MRFPPGWCPLTTRIAKTSTSSGSDVCAVWEASCWIIPIFFACQIAEVAVVEQHRRACFPGVLMQADGIVDPTQGVSTKDGHCLAGIEAKVTLEVCQRRSRIRTRVRMEFRLEGLIRLVRRGVWNAVLTTGSKMEGSRSSHLAIRLSNSGMTLTQNPRLSSLTRFCGRFLRNGSPPNENFDKHFLGKRLPWASSKSSL